MLNAQEVISFKDFFSQNAPMVNDSISKIKDGKVGFSIKEAQRAVLLTLALSLMASTSVPRADAHVIAENGYTRHSNNNDLYKYGNMDIVLKREEIAKKAVKINITQKKEEPQRVSQYIKDNVRNYFLKAPEHPRQYNPTVGRALAAKISGIKNDELFKRSSKTIANMEEFIAKETARLEKLDESKNVEEVYKIKRDIGVAYIVAQMERSASVIYSSDTSAKDKAAAKKSYSELSKEFIFIQNAYATEDILTFIDDVSNATMMGTPVGAGISMGAKAASKTTEKALVQAERKVLKVIRTKTELKVTRKINGEIETQVIKLSDKLLERHKAINAVRSDELEKLIASYRPKTLTLRAMDDGKTKALSIRITKDTIKHTFERQQASYWRFNNSDAIKANQTFLKKDMTLEQVEETIFDIVKQNETKLMAKQNAGYSQLMGKGKDGSTYIVGVKGDGSVAQFFKLKPSLVEYYKEKLGK